MDGRTMREPEDVERLLGTEPHDETAPVGGAPVGGWTVEPAEELAPGRDDDEPVAEGDVVAGGFMGQPSREEPLEDEDDDGPPYTLGTERR